ncbi:LuxR C-terminal-related transcriptional regulator [Nocardia sp. CS682]|uniref:helix-turn-helix transcriptional regulator n=1 Tax=Nocardia sp. CS682 TaxID=1047172 RepID=UPI001074BB81|nr:LuxR C-terminal-related transcriptional regulator [Nocardia sp. CS682]QBS44480.1 hypothetical protein DMB37_34740 [Nocardia sp. CS682]
MHSTQHPTCPAGSALPPGVALHRPERLGSNGNARLPIGDLEMRRVAQAIAVLDESATLARVARLLEAAESAIRPVLGRLTAAGLIDATTTRFHQSEFRERVLRHTAVDARKRLSHRAAGLLHLDGESPRTVAGLLLDAGYARYPWAAAVLLAAADDAMLQNQIYRAVQCLTLAYRVSLHAADRADISARMLSIEWQVKPSPTTRAYLRTTAAARAGLLDERVLRFLVRYALWHGQVDDAQVALEALERSASSDANSDEVAFFYAWLAYTHPDMAARGPREIEPAKDTGAPASADRQAATVLSAITTREPIGHIAIAAQELLTEHRLNPATVEPLATAIDGLVHAERLDLAQTWCDVLLAEANARSAPTWQSVFAGLRAEVSLRRGDLTAAEHYAQRALNQVAAKNLGTWVGSPVATLIRTLTAAGRYREAQTQLDRAMPLPMFASRFGLRYLHARGHLHLATHRFHDAIEDFRTCGELMQRWQIDLPVMVPWRNDLAQAYSAMGDKDNARTYARLHISHLGRADAHRTGGVSLRLLAAASTRQQDRLVLLRESEAIARVYDDQLEIALVLQDLADAYQRTGQPDRARALHRNADRLARRCGVKPLSGSAATEEPPVAVRSSAEIRSALSPAELRVATLAADGERNRDIADQLGITTSTVEQHLTRAFRKLHVGSRSELRFAMRTDDLLS